jgi:Domain of unknown function (DUF4387)
VTTLDDLASVLRSKNAGPFYITIDLFFPDLETYRRAAQPEFLTVEQVAETYGLEVGEVYGIYRQEFALGIKVTLQKRIVADDPANNDVMAGQQHLPLAALEVPALTG